MYKCECVDKCVKVHARVGVGVTVYPCVSVDT